MNYFKVENRKMFVDYWNSEGIKKLFRCSKEFGFYNKLKKVLHSSYSENRRYIIYELLNELLVELNRNKKDIVNFEHILSEDNNIQYPVYTALTSKIHLSHLFSLLLLQKCKIEHQTIYEAFNWLTIEIFKDNKCKAHLNEIRSYIKLFFT